MSKEKRSGCCLWRFIKSFFVITLLVVAFLWVCDNLACFDEEDTGYYEEKTTEEKEVNLPPSFDNNNSELEDGDFVVVENTYTDYYKEPKADEDIYCSSSRYNYTKVAEYITSGCVNDYERIRTIYQWICENIEYDTSYSIYTADSCYDTKKGVCQAYCELFYWLAKAVGVKVEIISGKSKDHYGNIGSSGHAWLFAYTRENHGILMDPTWGAGYVDNSKSTFSRRDNCWVWFNVNPEWMILSHFPEDESYQLLDVSMSYEEFLSLIPVNDLWVEYGFDVHKLYKKIRKKEIRLPNLYSSGEGKLKIIEIPLCDVLRIGGLYTFRIRKKTVRDFAIHNCKEFMTLEKWRTEGDSIYSIDYVVSEGDKVKLSIKGEEDNMWYSLVEYNVE